MVRSIRLVRFLSALRALVLSVVDAWWSMWSRELAVSKVVSLL